MRCTISCPRAPPATPGSVCSDARVAAVDTPDGALASDGPARRLSVDLSKDSAGGGGDDAGSGDAADAGDRCGVECSAAADGVGERVTASLIDGGGAAAASAAAALAAGADAPCAAAAVVATPQDALLCRRELAAELAALRCVARSGCDAAEPLLCRRDADDAVSRMNDDRTVAAPPAVEESP